VANAYTGKGLAREVYTVTGFGQENTNAGHVDDRKVWLAEMAEVFPASA
jgi:hypothetical protein